MCDRRFGRDRGVRVDVPFLRGQPPVGGLDGPSGELATDKIEFGRSRIARWSGPTPA